MNVRTKKLLRVILILLCTTGCVPSAVGTKARVNLLRMPPLAETVQTIPYLIPYSQDYRIGVLSFIDKTDRAKIVTAPLADMLTTALYQTRRFSLIDRGDFVLHDERTETEREFLTLKASGRVDGILIGYVTAFERQGSRGGYLEVDVRIVDSRLKIIVFSQSQRINFRAAESGETVGLARKDVEALAQSIELSFVDLRRSNELRVTDINQEQGLATVTLNVGKTNNVKQGFVGFVVERDPHTKVDHYLAKFVIQSVFPEASVGRLIEHCNGLDPFKGGTIIREIGATGKNEDTDLSNLTKNNIDKRPFLEEKITPSECSSEYDKIEPLEQIDQIQIRSRVQLK